jgi:CPA2 family monovalent cation:H+ antiporter-2
LVCLSILILYTHAWPVAILTLVVIFGQSISSIRALISELTPKQSIQIEWHWHKLEFSFIIATLGMSLNVTSDFLYPIVVAVSAVTTFTLHLW